MYVGVTIISLFTPRDKGELSPPKGQRGYAKSTEMERSLGTVSLKFGARVHYVGRHAERFLFPLHADHLRGFFQRRRLCRFGHYLEFDILGLSARLRVILGVTIGI